MTLTAYEAQLYVKMIIDEWLARKEEDLELIEMNMRQHLEKYKELKK